ncbi:synaptotagmin-7-like isoform X2 [Watersipora subatra]|uniref:synaptotagmin-7-like isoform X2 n=1 Tax=Watersipora subatra TaxID=2589382 RepID=UPI00355BA66F
MQAWILGLVIVGAVLITVAAILASLLFYFRHRKTKKRLAEAEALYGAKQQAENAKKAGKWNLKDRLVKRKTIRFVSPARQAEIRTEAVQPDVHKASYNINRQLGGYGSADPQKEPLLHVGSGSATADSDDFGGVDVSQYRSLLNYRLENADEYTQPPTNRDKSLGSILFALKYDFDNQNLELRIVRCWNLLAKDLRGTSDPYVKAIITPGSKKYFLETKKKMRNLNPVWKETFQFQGFPLAKLENKSLVLQVLDFDMLSKDDPIGEVELQLGSVNFYEPNIFHLYLSPCTGDRRGLGELMVSLSYNDVTNHLTVIIVKARNLKAKDINGLSDPYVKIHLLYQNQRIEKRKTEIHMKDLNPTFNESFEFIVERSRIKDSGLHIIVNDYDKWGKNELIGEIILSSRSGTQEIKHWNETLYKQNQIVSEWHALKKIKESRFHRTSSSTKP